MIGTSYEDATTSPVLDGEVVSRGARAPRSPCAFPRCRPRGALLHSRAFRHEPSPGTRTMATAAVRLAGRELAPHRRRLAALAHAVALVEGGRRDRRPRAG